MIRFGILGTSNYAIRSFIGPANKISNCEIFGVASRDEKRAKEYALNNKIPLFFSDYSDLLQSNEIEAVYIPLINSIHKEWIIKAANAGKHILVEKPICLNVKEGSEIKRSIEENNVFLLEGAMIQHHSFVEIMKTIIDKETYGKLKVFETNIHILQNLENNFRLENQLGGGVFMDMAPTWLTVVQRILGLNYVSYLGISDYNGPNKIDVDFKAEINLSSNIRCLFSCSFTKNFKANFLFKFENAEIEIKDFLRPAIGENKLILDILYYDAGIKPEKIKIKAENYYLNQLLFFISVIKGIKNNISIEESIQRIALIEKIYTDSQKRIIIS